MMRSPPPPPVCIRSYCCSSSRMGSHFWFLFFMLLLLFFGINISVGAQLPTTLTSPSLSSSCGTDVRNIIPKTFSSPYVFEATVIGIRKSVPLNSVTLRVDKVHKGNLDIPMGNKNEILLQFWSRPITTKISVQDNDDNNYNHNNNNNNQHQRVFQPNMFELRKKYIVFANISSNEDSGIGGRNVDNYNAAKLQTFTVFCEPVAQNKKSSRKIEKILKQVRPPTVTGLKNTTVKLNKRLKLVCRAKGRPMAKITWFKDGHPLVENSKVIVNVTRAVSQVTILNTSEGDGGLYECRATISETGLSSSLTATVTVKRRGKSRNKSRTHVPGQGQNIESPYTGKPCPVDNFCQNNGTCLFYESIGEPVCKCPVGYDGYRCNIKKPVVSNVNCPLFSNQHVRYILNSEVITVEETLLTRNEVDWTYQKSIHTVVVILGVLLCLTILSNVVYFIFRAKRKVQREKTRRLSGFIRKNLGSDGGTGIENAVEMQHVTSNRRAKIGRRNKGEDANTDFDERGQNSELLATIRCSSFNGIGETSRCRKACQFCNNSASDCDEKLSDPVSSERFLKRVRRLDGVSSTGDLNLNSFEEQLFGFVASGFSVSVG